MTTMVKVSEPEITISENQFFSFEKAKVQTITIEQLDRTYKENDVYGNPLRGIYHSTLIHNLVDMCNQQHYSVEIYDMFAAQNRDRNQPGVVILPKVEEQMGKGAVEAHILRRVFANIRIKDFDDAENTTNLAVAFHQKGIQVGFGNMVQICHNQCMLGASQYASTFASGSDGLNKMDIRGILDTVKSWLVDARRIVVENREKIEQMKKIEVSNEQLATIIGLLTIERVCKDTMNKKIRIPGTYPLNQSQISAFTEDMVSRYHVNGKATVWDLYDAATNLYKADKMDIPSLLPQNLAMSRFLDRMYFE